MKLESVSLERFTVFRKAEGIAFSPGINVLIGANGTGKTHLLKLLYCMVHTAFTSAKDRTSDPLLLAARLKDKLAMVFRPADLQTNRLVHRRQGRGTAKVCLATDSGSFRFRLTTSSNLYVDECALGQPEAPIFIPSREALAMYRGFAQPYATRELDFDETYYDLCVALSGSQTRGARLAKAAELAGPLESILGGKVRLTNERFNVKSGDGFIEAHLLAEGFRKIASIVHLINNGALMEKGILFWDEPEANLNPKLTTQVCTALRQLAAGGVQVFLATHDYLLSQELSLAAEYSTVPQVPIRFFALTRVGEERVTVQGGDTLAELEHNPILEELAAHYDREHKLFAKA